MVGSRGPLDRQDLFSCHRQTDGELLWQFPCPAPGRLDYGNSPRATPLIGRRYVWLLGAMGHLSCVERETGLQVWQKNLHREFAAPKLTWGVSGSPLIVDGKLIVQPGGKVAAVVALDPGTGDVVWQSPGIAPGYSSFVIATVGNRKQLVGYDARTLGGWDVATGKRLWTIAPPHSDDFNVPTPIVMGNRVFVATENNGARVYEFDRQGRLGPRPVAAYGDLIPDTHTPVVAGGHVYAVHDGLRCLSLADGLKQKWLAEDDAFSRYAGIIADEKRLLILTQDSELVLVAADPKRFRLLSRLELTSSGAEVHAHPALDGNRLFLRLGQKLVRLDL